MLNYLDNYAESVCLDCGYIHRECLCRSPESGLSSSSRGSPLTFVGHAYVRKDQSVQTDIPTVLSSTQVKPNSQPGISVLIPPGLQLQPGMRFPVTLAQTPSGNGGATVVNSPMFCASSADTTTVSANSTPMPFQGVESNCGWGANYISLPTTGQANSYAPLSFTLGQQNLFSPSYSQGMYHYLTRTCRNQVDLAQNLTLSLGSPFCYHLVLLVLITSDLLRQACYRADYQMKIWNCQRIVNVSWKNDR